MKKSKSSAISSKVLVGAIGGIIGGQILSRPASLANASPEPSHLTPFKVELVPSYGELIAEHAVLNIKDEELSHRRTPTAGQAEIEVEHWYNNFAETHPGVWTVISHTTTKYGYPAFLAGQKGKLMVTFPVNWVRYVGLAKEKRYV